MSPPPVIHATTGKERPKIDLRPSLTFLAAKNEDFNPADANNVRAHKFYDSAKEYFKKWEGGTKRKLIEGRNVLYLEDIIDKVNAEYQGQGRSRRPYLVINIVAHGNYVSWFIRTKDPNKDDQENAADKAKNTNFGETPSPTHLGLWREWPGIVLPETLAAQQVAGKFPHLQADRTAAGAFPSRPAQSGEEPGEEPTGDNPAVSSMGAADGWTEIRLWSCQLGALPGLLNEIAQLFIPRDAAHKPTDFAPSVCAPRGSVGFGTTGTRPPTPKPPTWTAGAPYYGVLTCRRLLAKSKTEWVDHGRPFDPTASDKAAARRALTDSLTAQRTTASQAGTLPPSETQIIKDLVPENNSTVSMDQVSFVDSLRFDDPRVIAAARNAVASVKKDVWDPKWAALKPGATATTGQRDALIRMLTDPDLAGGVADDLWKDAAIRRAVWNALAAESLDGVQSPEDFVKKGGWWSGTGRPHDPSSLDFVVASTPDAQTRPDGKIVRLSIRIVYHAAIFETDEAKIEEDPYFRPAFTDARFFRRVQDVTPDHLPEPNP